MFIFLSLHLLPVLSYRLNGQWLRSEFLHLSPRGGGDMPYFIYRHKLNLCENLKIFLIGCKIKHSLVNLQIFFAKSYVFRASSYKKYHFYAISLID